MRGARPPAVLVCQRARSEIIVSSTPAATPPRHDLLFRRGRTLTASASVLGVGVSLDSAGPLRIRPQLPLNLDFNLQDTDWI